MPERRKMIIMGIDPGHVRVGYGVIEKEGNKFIHRESGLIPLPEKSGIGSQLSSLEKELTRLVKKYRPSIVGLEKLFVSKNVKTAMNVAEARGVIRKVIFESGIDFTELAPQTIKLSVTGSGRADKKAVSKMVGLLLHMKTRHLIDDVTDALAIAIATDGKKF